MNTLNLTTDTAFELAVSNIRFGRGVTREVGMDAADMGLKRVMVLADPVVAKLQPVATVLDSLRRERVDFALFDRVRVKLKQPRSVLMVSETTLAASMSISAVAPLTLRKLRAVSSTEVAQIVL